MVVARGAAAAVGADVGLDRDGHRGAHGLAQLARDAALFAVLDSGAMHAGRESAGDMGVFSSGNCSVIFAREHVASRSGAIPRNNSISSSPEHQKSLNENDGLAVMLADMSL